MAEDNRIEGVLSPVVTPFGKDLAPDAARFVRHCKWLLANGGLAGIAAVNERKAGKLYAELDRTGFWKPTAQTDRRSRMNVTFRGQSEDLEKAFIKEATAAGFDGLKGHRSVGGMRASIYNAFPEQGIDDLVAFMRDFERRNG